MDLVVLIDDPAASLEPSHLVQMLGDLLERVRGFEKAKQVLMTGGNDRRPILMWVFSSTGEGRAELISGQATSESSNPHLEAQPRLFPCPPLR